MTPPCALKSCVSRQLLELPTSRHITSLLIAIKVCQIKQTEFLLALRKLHSVWVVLGTWYSLLVPWLFIIFYANKRILLNCFTVTKSVCFPISAGYLFKLTLNSVRTRCVLHVVCVLSFSLWLTLMYVLHTYMYTNVYAYTLGCVSVHMVWNSLDFP